MNESSNSSLGRQYNIEEFFSSYEEYERYLLKGLTALKGSGKKRRTPTLSKIFPEDLDIEFDSSIKHPRYRIPKFEGKIILVLPDRGYSPKKKALIRRAHLDAHIGVIKTNEIVCAEQIGMRMKILEKSKRKSRSREKAKS